MAGGTGGLRRCFEMRGHYLRRTCPANASSAGLQAAPASRIPLPRPTMPVVFTSIYSPPF